MSVASGVRGLQALGLVAGNDIVGATPLGLVQAMLQVGVAGEFIWLAETSKAGLAVISELLRTSQVEREWTTELTQMHSC